MIKITGLVRYFNSVRVQLQVGLEPSEVERFRIQVRNAIRQVEEICASHRATPAHLPGPSRLAYDFLKKLDLEKLPIRESGDAAPAKPIKVRNLTKIGDFLADRLWKTSSIEELAKIEAEFHRHSRHIEGLCEEQGGTPAALETPSRQIYTWLKFLSNPDNLKSHFTALGIAREVIRELATGSSRRIDLHLITMNSLWRARQYSDCVLIKINEGFVNAEREVWNALIASTLSGRSTGSRELIHEFSMSEDFNDLIFEIEALAAPPAPVTRGRVHNLDESFDRVNGTFFEGRMERPVLTWNQTLTVRKFGHYQPGRDTIMISVTLDHPKVPAMVVDFVMYHELLHKKHGSSLVNGRRIAHSPTFRAEERRFPYWKDAEEMISRIAAGTANGSGWENV